MAQSRYLFAIACFQMDLLKEAETALSPPTESNAEVLNDCLLMYIHHNLFHFLCEENTLIYLYEMRGRYNCQVLSAMSCNVSSVTNLCLSLVKML